MSAERPKVGILDDMSISCMAPAGSSVACVLIIQLVFFVLAHIYVLEKGLAGYVLSHGYRTTHVCATEARSLQKPRMLVSTMLLLN